MAVPVAVPKLGNRMRAGVVSEWYQPDGATVQAGDLVCCLECDSVVVDIEAEGDGVLRHRVQAGLVRPPGDLLGVVLARGERAPAFEPVDVDEILPGADDDPDVPPAGTVALRPADWQEPEPNVASADTIARAIAASPEFARSAPQHERQGIEEKPVAKDAVAPMAEPAPDEPLARGIPTGASSSGGPNQVPEALRELRTGASKRPLGGGGAR